MPTDLYVNIQGDEPMIRPEHLETLVQPFQLEQLRSLEHGIPICVIETPHDTIGVDAEEDLACVERYFQECVSIQSVGLTLRLDTLSVVR